MDDKRKNDAASEKEVKEADAADNKSPAELREKQRKTLFIYAAVLALVAVLLITVSYGVQLRQNSILQGEIAEKTQAVEGVSKRYQQLQTQNELLTKGKSDVEAELAALKAEYDKIKAMSDEASKLLEQIKASAEKTEAQLISANNAKSAYENMALLSRLYRLGQFSDCRVIITRMEDGGQKEYISQTLRLEYERIKTRVGWSK